MKPAMSLYSYGGDIRTGRMAVRDAIEHAASLGVKAVELVDEQHLPDWPYTSAAQIIELKSRIKSLGMEVCCFSTYLPDLIRSDRRATVAEIIEAAKKRIVIAELLETRIVRPAYIGTGFNDLAAVIHASIPMLETCNLIWGIEIHAPYKPLDFLALYNHEFAGCRNVKLVPDFSCWQRKGLPGECGFESVDSLRKVVPITAHVHGKAHTFDATGEEPNTPYGDLLSVLKEEGYKDYIVAEYEGWMFQDLPSREVAATHLDLIRRYL